MRIGECIHSVVTEKNTESYENSQMAEISNTCCVCMLHLKTSQTAPINSNDVIFSNINVKQTANSTYGYYTI